MKESSVLPVSRGNIGYVPSAGYRLRGMFVRTTRRGLVYAVTLETVPECV